jgi:hypothetical protein
MSVISAGMSDVSLLVMSADSENFFALLASDACPSYIYSTDILNSVEEDFDGKYGFYIRAVCAVAGVDVDK